MDRFRKNLPIICCCIGRTSTETIPSSPPYALEDTQKRVNFKIPLKEPTPPPISSAPSPLRRSPSPAPIKNRRIHKSPSPQYQFSLSPVSLPSSSWFGSTSSFPSWNLRRSSLEDGQRLDLFFRGPPRQRSNLRRTSSLY